MIADLTLVIFKRILRRMGNGANCEILNLENIEVLYQIWMKIMKCFTVVVLTLSMIQYY